MSKATAVPEAVQIMIDDGVPPERAASLALAAQRDGGDPIAFARHFVKLRTGLRAFTAGRTTEG